MKKLPYDYLNHSTLKADSVLANVYIPKNYTLITNDLLQHPKNKELGYLFRIETTGMYTFWCNGTYMSVPQDWAEEIALEAQKQLHTHDTHVTQ